MSLRPIGYAIALAIALGVVAEVLFDGPALGIGLLAFIALLLGAGLVVGPADTHLDRSDLWLAPGALVFAAFIALRDDPTLVRFDLVAALALATGAALALSGTAVTRTAIENAARLGGWAVAIVLTGSGHLLERARPSIHVPAVSSASTRALGTLARGLLIAAIPLSIFVALFATADSVFARTLIEVTRISLDMGDVPSHAAFVMIGTWLAGGFLAIIVFGTDVRTSRGRSLEPWGSVFFGSGPEPGAAAAGPGSAGDPADGGGRADAPLTEWGLPPDAGAATVSPRLRLGWAEATVVLVAIELVFAVFIVIQVAYLFGGRDTLAASGQTYSQYATRGFQELVAVAVLAGAMILSLEAVVERRTRVYKAAAVGLLVMTGIVLASAFLRLRLYQDAYGWTELRFYVFSAIVYLGLAIVAVGTLVLRDRSRWSLHALGLGAIVVAVAVNLVEPHVFVADQNVARAIDPSLVPAGGRSGLDAQYVLSLSDDAVPTLVAALPWLPEPNGSLIEEGLRQRSAALTANPALRSPSAWNLARMRAREALDTLPPR